MERAQGLVSESPPCSDCAAEVAELHEHVEHAEEEAAVLRDRLSAVTAELEALRARVEEPAPDVRIEQVGELTTSLLGELEDGVLGACDATERGVLVAGECIQRIVTAAREQGAATEEVQRRIEHATKVSAVVEKQSDAIRGFTGEVTKQLVDQRETAERAVRESKTVIAAGQRISAIAAGARILSLNAQIEASRLGAVGKPFAVIATEMSDLVTEIETTNKVVGELAESLTRLLPQFLEMTSTLENVAAGFAKDLDGHIEQVADAEEGVQEVVRRATEIGRSRIDEILSTANDSLSALQFQDPVQQRLLLMRDHGTRIAESLKALLTGEEMPEPRETSDEFTAPLPEGDPLDASESGVEAGEVLLF